MKHASWSIGRTPYGTIDRDKAKRLKNLLEYNTFSKSYERQQYHPMKRCQIIPSINKFEKDVIPKLNGI